MICSSRYENILDFQNSENSNFEILFFSPFDAQQILKCECNDSDYGNVI